MLLRDLNGTWKMKRVDEREWIPAQVPGSVYHDLLQAKKMQDPFFRDNEYEALNISSHDFEYRRQFTLSGDMLAHDRVLLRCEGLDTLCQVFINGVPVLSSSNMHRIYETDVRDHLVLGENTIRAVFSSPTEYVLEKQKEFPLVNSSDAVEGISHLRKAHCMFGWDWGPKLPDMGIWRDISIIGFDSARLDDVRIVQDHREDGVMLNVDARIDQWSGGDLQVRVEVTDPSGRSFYAESVAADGENPMSIFIDEPRLWWPNTMGDQPLYQVRVTLTEDTRELDTREMCIGLRTLTVRREKDAWGESFCFVVNGVPVFAKGADYIPEDNILARCSRGRTERLIRSCVMANFNCIRVWGGAYYPENYFYDLCDEYGLMVWQDLMYACGVYALTDDFRENIIEETRDNMKRLRHHASLGMWCGNNEQEWGWVSWGWTERCSPRLKADYIKQYEVLLPEVAEKTDPGTFYWPASPSSGGCFDRPNAEDAGDMHYWEVWHGKLPFTAYRTIFPRFMSEFGIQSFPCLKTVKSFTLPVDRNIFSYVMESHQKNGTGNEKILYYIGETYRMPKDFDSLLYVSQLIQAEGLRYGVEHWRRNRDRCMGAVYWQLNDCWPVASWASIDYFGRWKALQYAARRFFAPVLISACEDGLSVSLHGTNDTLEKVTGRLRWRLMEADGTVVKSQETDAEIDGQSAAEWAQMDFSELLDIKDRQRKTYLEYQFITEGTVISEGTVLFVKPKHFAFADPRLALSVAQCGENFVVTVSAQSFARSVELDLRDDDAIFGDNDFDLSAGCTKRVEVAKTDLSRPLTLAEFKDQLTVRSLFDTYE